MWPAHVILRLAIVVIMALVGGVVTTHGLGHWAHNIGTRLLPGDSLAQNECLCSDKAELKFCLSPAGVLQLWRGSVIVWQKGSPVPEGHKRYLVLQDDGNLVLYENAQPPDPYYGRRVAVWASDTMIKDIRWLSVEETGVVLRAAADKVAWSLVAGRDFDALPASSGGTGRPLADLVFDAYVDLAKAEAKTKPKLEPKPRPLTVLHAGEKLHVGENLTSPNGLNRLSLNAVGAMSLHSQKALLWYVGTDKCDHSELWVQHDGNLVRYCGSRATWSTQTNGRAFGVTSLRLKDDCDLVLEDEAGRTLWSAQTSAVWFGKAYECPQSPQPATLQALFQRLDPYYASYVTLYIAILGAVVLSILLAFICEGRPATQTQQPQHQEPTPSRPRKKRARVVPALVPSSSLSSASSMSSVSSSFEIDSD